MDECPLLVQQHIRGHHGRKGDLLYSAHQSLHTRADLLPEKQQD